MIILTKEEQVLLHKLIDYSEKNGFLTNLDNNEVKLMVNLQYKLGKEL